MLTSIRISNKFRSSYEMSETETICLFFLLTFFAILL